MDSQPGDQRRYFVHVLLPELFYANPEGLLDMLGDRSGGYLQFLWERAGESAGRASTSGEPSVQIVGLDPDSRMGLVRLPEPSSEREALFLALVHRPSRLTLGGVRRSITRLFSLERSHSSGRGTPDWILHEQTRDGLVTATPTPLDGPDELTFLIAVRSALNL
jgi:hypothetical protein